VLLVFELRDTYCDTLEVAIEARREGLDSVMNVASGAGDEFRGWWPKSSDGTV
jgi:hypothetical protein